MAQDPDIPLAHSAPSAGLEPQAYAEHARNVRSLAEAHAEAIADFASASPNWIGWTRPISVAAEWHDLGKLDPENQAILAGGRKGSMPWDHIDAGVAHALRNGDQGAAWLIRAHHSPGLPSAVTESSRESFHLRGYRHGIDDDDLHRPLVNRNNSHLDHLRDVHTSARGGEALDPAPSAPAHGLPARLALACLVDADHRDTARFDEEGAGSPEKPDSPDPRWAERLEALREHVAKEREKARAHGNTERNEARQDLFDHCADDASIEPRMATCDATVGLGKTTAVLAYLLRQAITRGLRRIVIVAPFTNILSQTAATLRKAIILPGDEPDEVILEHHHRADFSDRALLASSVAWDAPIILTTAVQLFETLGACDPSSLKKLHRLPGSALFIDEAHAALPFRMWPHCFEWLRELAESWTCPMVLASGSQVKFWEHKWGRAGHDPDSVALPDITPASVAEFSRKEEPTRVVPDTAPKPLTCCELADLVTAALKKGRPQLVILNTIHSAVGLAKMLSESEQQVLHLSTALTPFDRERVLGQIKYWTESADSTPWVLVATSCVEAGVDLDFHDGFREDASVASFIQSSGRINRNGLWKASRLTRFRIDPDDPSFNPHPQFKHSAAILEELFPALVSGQHTSSELVTAAAKKEVTGSDGERSAHLLAGKERCSDYPRVAELCQVIASDTVTVVACEKIYKILLSESKVPIRELLRHSVQLWPKKIESLGLDPISTSKGGTPLYFASKGCYDPEFLGIGKALLQTSRSEHDFLNC